MFAKHFWVGHWAPPSLECIAQEVLVHPKERKKWVFNASEFGHLFFWRAQVKVLRERGKSFSINALNHFRETFFCGGGGEVKIK